MDSGMIGKIKKAKEYAQELERMELMSLEVSFKGTNNMHDVSYEDGKWQCDCDYFRTREYCSHTMALEQVLEGLIPE